MALIPSPFLQGRIYLLKETEKHTECMIPLSVEKIQTKEGYLALPPVDVYHHRSATPVMDKND